MATDNLVKLLSIPILLALVVVAIIPFYAGIAVNYLPNEDFNNSLVNRVVEQGEQTIGFAEDLQSTVTVVSVSEEEDSGGFFSGLRDLFSNVVGSVIQSALIIFNSIGIFGVLFSEGVGALQLQGNFNQFLVATGTTLVLLVFIGIFLKWVFKI